MNNKKIYIEAGANDGIFQSRSLFLDNDENFLGILIEPITSVYKQCTINRPKCLSYNCALVDFDFPSSTIDINIHNMYSAMNTLVMSVHQKYSDKITVPARTLDSILDENQITHIDSFFLDVEGYELNVLKGIDFTKRYFNMIEVECHYTLLDIDKNQEVEGHQRYLAQFGYVLTDTNNNDGNLKLVFTPKV